MDIAIAMPDIIGRLERRLMTELADEAEQWSWCLNALSRWEDEHLLDKPSPELLAEHKRTVDRLIKLGKLLSLATSHTDFPDRKTADMVDATMSGLQISLDLWHRPRMSKEGSEAILARCFPDEQS